MPDEATQPNLPPDSPLPFEGDRRQNDRRQNDRQGKYDRRKNRCVHCAHFKEAEPAGKGHCQKHSMTMAAYAFACPQFSPLLTQK